MEVVRVLEANDWGTLVDLDVLKDDKEVQRVAKALDLPLYLFCPKGSGDTYLCIEDITSSDKARNALETALARLQQETE